MKVSEASSENSVLENKLILLDGRIVLKRLEKLSLLGLMERNLETTELQISLEASRSATLKRRETGSEMARAISRMEEGADFLFLFAQLL